jgi:acyl carrier protein phosphodiesterase
MNYLAHGNLSGSNDLIKVGNFMADSVKGNQYLNYEKELQYGILLHRHIDSFTDAHPIYRQSKHRLHEKYGHYSGVIMDILYDHFLAKNWKKYSFISLPEFARDFYQILENNLDLLPEKTTKIVPYLVTQNWFESYASVTGIEKILFQMNYKTHHRVAMHEAVIELKKYNLEFESEFFLFFDVLSDSCKQKMIDFE